MPKKKTGQRKKADKQKARLKEIRNKGKNKNNFVEHFCLVNANTSFFFPSHKVDIFWKQKYTMKVA